MNESAPPFSSPPPSDTARLQRLAEAIHRQNRSINLTAARDIEQIGEHIADSLTLLSIARELGCDRDARWIDIGSGGGFPALPLAIALPDVAFTLVESVGKKCHALEAIIAELELSNCRVLCERAETLGHHDDLRASFHFATSRAVGPIAVQAELALPFLAPGGRMLLQQSSEAETTLNAATPVFDQLGGMLKAIQRLADDRGTARRLVAVIEKTAPTPAAYPRRVGLPAKRPLR